MAETLVNLLTRLSMDMVHPGSAEPWWKLHLARIHPRALAAGLVSGPLQSLAAWRPPVTLSDLARGSRRVVVAAVGMPGLTFSPVRHGVLPDVPSGTLMLLREKVSHILWNALDVSLFDFFQQAGDL